MPDKATKKKTEKLYIQCWIYVRGNYKEINIGISKENKDRARYIRIEMAYSKCVQVPWSR